MMKVYCEHGALTKEIRKLCRSHGAELVHFPYDPDSNARAAIATPSKARICDLNLPIKSLPATLTDYSGSAHLGEIVAIVGASNRRDVLHIDSALKHGCEAFVTTDKDHILEHRKELEDRLGMKFFHPTEHSDLESFVSGRLA